MRKAFEGSSQGPEAELSGPLSYLATGFKSGMTLPKDDKGNIISEKQRFGCLGGHGGVGGWAG